MGSKLRLTINLIVGIKIEAIILIIIVNIDGDLAVITFLLLSIWENENEMNESQNKGKKVDD